MKPVNIIDKYVRYIRLFFCFLFFIVGMEKAFPQSVKERRINYLKESLQINEPKDHRHSISLRVSQQDSTWLEWQRRTGELPPDFSQMKSELYLPEPLMWKGKRICTKEEWKQKVNWIKEEFQYWISGHYPPPPQNIQSKILSEYCENGVRVQFICLYFGPLNQAKMRFKLMIPPGKGPFPVYMTQWTHQNWADVALKRGYLTCVYAGCDDFDDTENYRNLYPEYDFTCLMRRAWGASRVVDYLIRRKEVDSQKIAITGHSRNGKQSLWAAAFDDRISAVISSSCGTGGVTPFRFSDPQYCTQTIDDICSNAAHWFQPRLRFFFGRENYLPIDQNLLLSLIAPRSLLIHYSIMERQLSPWATEHCFKSIRSVFSFFGATEKIGILPRYGEHPITTRDLEKCIDFLDLQFHRKEGKWENVFFCNYDFKQWENAIGKFITYDTVQPEYLSKHRNMSSYEKQKENILNKLKWLLGEKPVSIQISNAGFVPKSRMDWIDNIIGRPRVKNAFNWNIGPYHAMKDHLSGYFYCPDTISNRDIPIVIYLHQYAYAHGSGYGYNSFNTPNNEGLFQKLVNNGFAVLSIDMIGFGTRLEEGTLFYDRYPYWSLMGQMVDDVISCIDAIEDFLFINKDNIFVLGNTIGSAVGLMSAALDSRITGVIAFSGFNPWRDEKCNYSLRNFAEYNGFLPRLGFWLDDPLSIPIDFPEIISTIVPRPIMLISPSMDKYLDNEIIQNSIRDIESCYELYNSKQQFEYYQPKEINRLTNTMIDYLILFLKTHLKK